MNRPRKKRRRSPAANSAPESVTAAPGLQYGHGFVLVHGIGPTSPGSTLRSVARPAADLLTETYGDGVRWEDTYPVAGQRAAILELSLGGAPRSQVLIVESRWTELTASPRFTFHALWWTLITALTLLPYVLGPGFKEMTRAESQMRGLPDGKMPGWRHAPILAGILGTTLWRVSVLGIFVAFTLQLIQWGYPGWITLGILVVAGILALALSPTDFAGQVRMIATQEQVKRTVLDSVAETVGAVQAVCSRVTIVGHSQGGYISYELLRDRGLTRLRSAKALIGIGSGLKPIRILASMRGRRAVVGTIVFTIGGAVMLVGATLAATQMNLATWPSFDSSDPSAWMRSLSDWMWSTWLAQLPYFAVMIVGLSVVGVATFIRRRFTAEITAVPDLPGIVWEEWATAHDIVGRFAMPALPARVTTRIAPGSHSLLDHLLSSYFRRGGNSGVFLAQRLVNESRAPQAVKKQWASVVAELNAASLAHASRWYAYRGFVQLSVFVALLVLPMFFGVVDLIGTFTRTWIVFLVFGVIATMIGWFAIRRRARRDHAEFLKQITSLQPQPSHVWELPPPRRKAYWVRTGATLVMFALSWTAVVFSTALAAQVTAFAPAALLLLLGTLLLGTYFSAVAADFAVPAWISIVIPPAVLLLSVACGVLAFHAGVSIGGEWIGSTPLAAISLLGLMLDIPSAFVRRHQRREYRHARINGRQAV